MTYATLDAIIQDIAHVELNIPTLETRNRDEADFHQVAVWAVKTALRRAYLEGVYRSKDARAHRCHEVQSSSTVREEWGLACPKCRRDDRLQVELTTMADLTAYGTEPFGDQQWDRRSHMRCDACGHSGKVARFQCAEVRP